MDKKPLPLEVMCKCGGVVRDEIELAVTSDETLRVIGKCWKCHNRIYYDFSLYNLLFTCPTERKVH